MSGELTPYNPDALPVRASATAQKLIAGGPVDPAAWTLYANIATQVANTEFVPPGLRNKPPSILACLLYGHDLGLGPMVALREITMIDGKPALSAALVTARVRQAGHRMEWRQLLADDGEFLGVTAYGERTDGSKGEYTFTLKMAQRAGLMRANGPYFKYPESMCWARAATQLARMLFSDVFLGHATYSPEELGGPVEIADAFVEELDEGSAALGAPADTSGETEPSESKAAASSPQPGATPAASTPASGPEGVSDAPSGPSPFAPPASATGRRKITQDQVKRLYTIATNRMCPDAEVKRMIWEVAGVASSKELTRDEYETVVALVEAWEPEAEALFVAPDAAA